MFGKIKYGLFLLSWITCSCQSEGVALKIEVANNIVDALPYYNSPYFSPIWEASSEDTFHTIKPFEFQNQNGDPITQDTYEDKVYLSNFFFTSCGGICPKMMRHMEYVQNAFKSEERVKFLSHSVMPAVDSVSKLKTYANNFNVIAGKWDLVTGNKTAIYDMARKSYFAEEEPGYNKDSTEFLHTEHFILVDKTKRIRGIYNGTVKLEMDRIIDDIQLLLTE